MSKRFNLTASAAAMALALSSTLASAGTVTSKGEDIVIDTTGGFKAETASGKFKFKLGGRMMWDYDFYDGAYSSRGPSTTQAERDRIGDSVDHDNLRRARLELKGTAYTDWEYVFAINFGQGGGSSINDMGIAYKGFKNQKIFLGRGKEPFGLEELTSSKWISTAERAMFWDSTTSDGQSNFGIRYDGYFYDLVNVQVGVFDPAGGVADSNGSTAFAKTGRITVAPIAEKGQVLHFGLAYSDRPAAEAGSARLINASPGVSAVGKNGPLASILRQGTAGNAEEESQWGFEALGIFGPASLQFEYFGRDVNVDSTVLGQGDQDVSSWYLLGTYTLTGESRGYKAKGGVADKISPKGRYGAIELVARYDHIEADTGGDENLGVGLTASGDTDPEVDAITLGVNWYVNKNVKLVLNYTDVSSDNLVADSTPATPTFDDGDAVLFRAQYAF